MLTSRPDVLLPQLQTTHCVSVHVTGLHCLWGGPYGFARSYEHGSGEIEAMEGVQDYDPVMSERQFHKWVGKKVSLFGIVESRTDDSASGTEFSLSIRTLQARNLCETSDDDTCRVTVSDNAFGTVHALVKLKPTDQLGQLSVGTGSLLRVIGTLQSEQSDSGHPVIAAEYYRHWPSGYFVTTKARQFMRQ